MKNLFLVLALSLASLPVFSNVLESVTFDFKTPSELEAIPSLPTIPEGNGDVINITDTKLFGGPVTISFGKGSGNSGAAINSSGSLFSLSLRKMATMSFSIDESCSLMSIEFTGSTGSLILPTGQPGVWNYATNLWESNSSDVHSVRFENGFSADARIYQIKVNYERPSVPLVLNATNPALGSIVSSCKSIQLYFNTPISLLNSEGISFVSPDFAAKEGFSITTSGNVATFTLNKEVEATGNCLLTVPAGKFQNNEGSLNQSFFTKFRVRIPVSPIGIIPAEGTYSYLPEFIYLDFPDVVTVNDTVMCLLKCDGVVKYPLTLKVDSTINTRIVISNPVGLIDKEGVWTIEIPENAIHNSFLNSPDKEYDSWNDDLSFSYSIVKPGAVEMRAATELLSKAGVGYPSENSFGRIALQTAVNKGDSAKVEELNEAMAAFYEERDITLPNDSSWYRIIGVNTTEDKMAYLHYEKDSVGLSANPVQGSAFMALRSDDNQITFKTSDGRMYLHVLTNNNNYSGTSTTNVTANETMVNKLTIGKLEVEGADSTKTLGKVSITGLLGFDNTMQFATSTAAIDYTNLSIVNSPTDVLYFDDELSSAFIISATEGPVVDSLAVYPEASFRSRQIQKPGDELVLIIHNVKSASLKNAQLPYFMQNEKRVDVTGDILTPLNEGYDFSVNTKGLSSGYYSLILPEGTFSFEPQTEGKVVVDQSLAVDFLITEGSSISFITPEASFRSKQIEKAGDNLVLIIHNVKSASLSDDTLPYFTQEGTRITTTEPIISPMDGAYYFAINTSGLNSGNYTLVLPQGTFNFVSPTDDKVVRDITLTADFFIKNGIVEPIGNFDFSYTFVNVLQYITRREVNYIADTDLNDLVLFNFVDIPYTGLYANPQVQVSVVSALLGGTLATGHFENYPEFAEDYGSDYQGTQAIRLVLDSPIKAGELDNFPGIYGYRIEEGAFGDANYNKWIEDHNSVKEEECVVNPVMTTATFSVNNDRASSIAATNSDKLDESVYDLQGRPLNGKMKQGIYIMNGKKVVVK